MAALKQCPNGHYYDPSIFPEYPECPYCSQPNCHVDNFFTYPEYPSCNADINPQALKKGVVLQGRYYIQQYLNHGGFGIVYLARDSVLEISVVIKECFPADIANRASDGLGVTVLPENQESFEQSQKLQLKAARALIRGRYLAHIPEFLNTFQENGTCYLVMEYIPGLTLREYMNRLGRQLTVSEAKYSLLPILDDLQKMHELGLFHRDIAPDNIIINNEMGRAVLIDFGAMLAREGGMQNRLVLKHGFAPPEQYRHNGNEGPWTDIYAFAATFYYAVTGKVPPNAVERLYEDELIPPRALNISISNQAQDALLKMLSIKEDERCLAVMQFRDSLSEKPRSCMPSSPLSSFEAEPVATTCCMPSHDDLLPKASRPGIGGLFSRLLKKERKSKFAPSLKSDDIGCAIPVATQEPPAAESLHISDVEFSALFPKRFVKGEYSILEIYLYEETQRQIVERAISEAEGTVKEKRGSPLRIQAENSIRILLECADRSVQIEGNDDSQIWHGRYLKFDYAVFLEENYPKRQLMFTATVLINNVPATRLRFTAECNTLREQKMELSREDILSAFISYASQDRGRVASIIQGMKKARPEMDVFFDVDSLRSGESWEKALRAEIERRDILFLCWSLAAKQSEWVDKEWRYALYNKGLDSIEPIPIDPPNICPPPKELASKHFNDRSLLYMDK